MDISKEQFEQVLYVATSAHMEVFDSVQPYLSQADEDCTENIFGGLAVGDEHVRAKAMRFVCLDAFLRVFRQLDLVLTPTGFGVVSNQTTSPASKLRVDALEAQLFVERERARGALVYALTKVKGWADTEAAHRCIRTLYYDIRFLLAESDKQVDFAAWRAAQSAIKDTDLILRKRIGDEMMDELLDEMRRSDYAEGHYAVVLLIQDIITLAILKSPLVGMRIRNLVNKIEARPDDFAAYMNSQAYKVNHYETFRNKKDSPGFFFVG